MVEWGRGRAAGGSKSYRYYSQNRDRLANSKQRNFIVFVLVRSTLLLVKYVVRVPTVSPTENIVLLTKKNAVAFEKDDEQPNKA